MHKKIEKVDILGNCLITLATAQMEKSEQDRTGLVDSHAYAVLDLRKLDDGKCLFLVKNPWTHLRWKGRYSEKDLQSWTPGGKINYNQIITIYRIMCKTGL
jgi:hypothetical protein